MRNFGKKKKPKISLLIPFSSKDPVRRKNFQWLLQYWKHELPDAEIIIGKSKGRIFCKGEALNNAFKKSSGKVIAVVDADAYIPGHIIERCANRILEEHRHHLWYVPYNRLYRLTEGITKLILDTDPTKPVRLPRHPPHSFYENSGDKSKYGHRYGAMLTIFPREAVTILGCFDERFKGWGGEDIAFLRAVDTLYGKHKIVNDNIFHLWHPFFGGDYKSRIWAGQTEPEVNGWLANRYHQATRHPLRMRELVDAGCKCIK